MPLGTTHTTATTAAVMIPDMWSTGVNDFFRANLKAAAFFEDWSADLAGGGDSIKMPNISQMTANSMNFGSTTQVTLNAPTHGSVTLLLNTHKETSFLIQDDVMVTFKKSYNLQERWMRNAAYTTAAALEDALLALFSGFSTYYGHSAIALYDSAIRSAISALDVANVPQEDRAFFMYPATVWSDIMSNTKFGLAVNTAGADPLLKGAAYSLYGIPVVMTSRISTSTDSSLAVHDARLNALVHKSALAFAVANPGGGTSEGPVRLQAAYLQEYLGTLVTADIIYGVIENRDNAGVLLATTA